MKKYGFTLAEVLITLGIIGVIATLTMPALNVNVSKSKIGPTLAKAVNSFEQANLALLNAKGVDGIDMIYSINSTYLKDLSDYLRGSYNGTTFTTNDNIQYTLSSNTTGSDTSSVAAHKQHVADVTVNIAPKRTPADADTVFYFTMWNDGSLIPKGAEGWAGTAANSGVWSDSGKCPNGAVPTDKTFCAGSIFANNLNVKYK